MNDNNTKPATLQVEAEQALTAQLNEAAAKGLPFPVGGALTSIKTLLERDPCSHAKTAIAMIDAILLHGCAAQPAPVQELADAIEQWLGQPTYHDGFGRGPDLWSLEQIKAAVTAILTTPPAAPAQDPAAWEMFPAYLIDKCEGDIISEEGLQRALADMLSDPAYATPPSAQRQWVGHGRLDTSRSLYDGRDPLLREKNAARPAPTNDIGAVMPCGAVVTNVHEAYDAGKKAAAQPPTAPVQPVAWMHEWDDGERIPMLRKRDVDSSDIDSPKSVRPLVFGDTTPPAQPAVPLNPMQPMQPIVDVNGIKRFKANAIVCHLIDTHPSCDMNTLSRMDFSDEDRMQFAQLIGYSLGGYGDLSYVSDESYEAAEQAAHKEIMHWDGDDGEDGPSGDIASLLNNIVSNRDLEVGEVVHITRATRLPDVWVRVTKIPEDADVEYEVIPAAPEKGGAA